MYSPPPPLHSLGHVPLSKYQDLGIHYTLHSHHLSIQLFQLWLSPSKAEKSNTSAKSLLGIAKKLMNFLTIPSKPFALVFDFSALLRDNLN